MSLRTLFLALSLMLVVVTSAFTQTDRSHLTEAIDEGLRVATYGMPVARLLDGEPVKRETGRRMADAAIINGVITQALKRLIDSPRPHGGHQGFPSGHTSSAFATAMSLAAREPETTWIAFPLAAAAGWARVDLEEHTWGQVLAGAALGTAVGYMCGTGQWRLFGHRDAPATTVATAAEAAPSSALFDPLPPIASSRMVWGTTVWSTRF